MKKLALLAAVVTALTAALRSRRARHADAELWQEATAPRDPR